MHWTIHLEGGPQRVNHAAVAVGSKIYSFGGYSTHEEVTNRIDLHVLDTVTLRWSIEYYQIGKTVPYNRYGHTVVVYKKYIYLWGGRNDLNSSSTLYCYDIGNSTWSSPAVKGTIPYAADGHTACVVGDYMYLFGGFQEQTEKFSQTLYRLHFLTFTWEEVNTRGNKPSSRDFHTASVIGNKMYIFGGRSSVEDAFDSDIQNEYYCNKIVCLNTQNMMWETPEVCGDIPCGRRSHSAVVYENEIYIFGGYVSDKQQHLNDFFKFNPETHRWTKLIATGEGPCPRRRHCACVVDKQMFLFGGSSPSSSEDDIFYLNEEYQRLIDHSDLHVLDFFPSLKRLCQLKVIENELNVYCLPRRLIQEINLMVKNNIITTHSFFPRRDFGIFAMSA